MQHSIFWAIIASTLSCPGNGLLGAHQWINWLQPRHTTIKNHKDSVKSYEPTLTSGEVIAMYNEEIKGLRGKPELVDRLENLVAKYPGVEIDMNLYRAIYPFELDEFQEKGLTNLIAGNNVLVSTPTGSGKTVVGELAIYFALMMGLRVAYTTPLKALSNQKFKDFTDRYGGDRVGLLTGDIVINRGAQITIMTTEVFRNMIYDSESESQLSSLFMVCFDEFHFMNDPDRGTVWEESVISCPPSVRILALSATMGNVGDIQGWMNAIHGPTELVISDHRPVPLRYLYAIKNDLLPLFRDPNAGPGSLNGVKKTNGKIDAGLVVNPAILKIEEVAFRNAQTKLMKSGRSPRNAKVNPINLIPRYGDVAEELHGLKLLPAIVFIFSRAGCEDCAKMVMQSRARLLSEEEVIYVGQAINLFARTHPEIPILKSSVQMLRAGVGVHHAGLIPVWKAFIEDLFNANKIKVLFATETLAAGVNMPARTTIISTVTKRISSELVKLKTSQLLQMAGRAGRRGKDIEGTVVILRNRFEDVQLAHKILVSPVDGIRSHFKTSYGLTVKLLETKSLEDCRALIEKGFGSYLALRKAEKRKGREQEEVEQHRDLLRKYSLAGARDYLKLIRRLEKEQRNEEFLLEKMRNTDSDLVHAIAEYMPLGIGLQLRSGDSGFFLGDVKWGPSNINSGFGLLTRDGRLLVVKKEHIRAFADVEDSIDIRHAQALLDLVPLATAWEELHIEGCKKPALVATYSLAATSEETHPLLGQALEGVRQAKPFPQPQLPGSVVRQQMIIDDIKGLMAAHPVSINGEGESVLNALRYAAALKDPVGFVSASPDKVPDGPGDPFAWKVFQNVVKILLEFGAMVPGDAVVEPAAAVDATVDADAAVAAVVEDAIGSSPPQAAGAEESSGSSGGGGGYTGVKAVKPAKPVPTELGRMVSSLSADNELWLALTLQLESVQNLTSSELAAVICSVVTDGFKASNAYFRYKPSDPVRAVYEEMERRSWDLKSAQAEVGIEFPVYVTTEVGGMVECWAGGVSWRELCRDTSLDQGDLCRMLRRTVEVLRQIPSAYGVTNQMAQMASEAAQKMDRFPVADLDSSPVDLSDAKAPAPAGTGFGGLGESAPAFPGDSLEDSSSNSSSDYFNLDDIVFDDDTEDDEYSPANKRSGPTRGFSIDEKTGTLDLDLDELLSKFDSASFEKKRSDDTSIDDLISELEGLENSGEEDEEENEGEGEKDDVDDAGDDGDVVLMRQER